MIVTTRPGLAAPARQPTPPPAQPAPGPVDQSTIGDVARKIAGAVVNVAGGALLWRIEGKGAGAAALVLLRRQVVGQLHDGVGRHLDLAALCALPGKTLRRQMEPDHPRRQALEPQSL